METLGEKENLENLYGDSRVLEHSDCKKGFTLIPPCLQLSYFVRAPYYPYNPWGQLPYPSQMTPLPCVIVVALVIAFDTVMQPHQLDVHWSYRNRLSQDHISLITDDHRRLGPCEL